MIRFYSRLPWKQLLNKKKQKYQLYAADNLTCVVENVPDLADAMYIEEACNNYPKAIELLKWSQNCFNEIQKYKTYAYKFPETATLGHEVNKFLKQIENDN